MLSIYPMHRKPPPFRAEIQGVDVRQIFCKNTHVRSLTAEYVHAVVYRNRGGCNMDRVVTTRRKQDSANHLGSPCASKAHLSGFLVRISALQKGECQWNISLHRRLEQLATIEWSEEWSEMRRDLAGGYPQIQWLRHWIAIDPHHPQVLQGHRGDAMDYTRPNLPKSRQPMEEMFHEILP